MKKIAVIVIFMIFASMSISGAETINLLTEDYPPFNMRVNGERDGKKDDPLTGMSVDIVNEIFKQAGIEYTISIYPWIRSYETAMKKPGYGVFSTFKTPEREPLFHWVGPLVPNKWILMGKKDRNIKINSIDEICKYKIGGYRGDAIAEFIKKKGCEVEITAYDYLNARKLDKEKIDLWTTGNMSGPYIAKKEGISGLEQVFVIKESPMYLALNKSISSEIVNKLNEILKKMKEDGRLEEIYSRYR